MVVVRKGKVKPSEFRLRDGEVGLSLDLSSDQTGPDAILAAVRAAGKQGESDFVEIPESVIRELGLRLLRTPGGTPDHAVNVLHVEAGPTWWRRLVLRFRGTPIHEWFNEHIAPNLAAAAKFVE